MTFCVSLCWSISLMLLLLFWFVFKCEFWNKIICIALNVWNFDRIFSFFTSINNELVRFFFDWTIDLQFFFEIRFQNCHHACHENNSNVRCDSIYLHAKHCFAIVLIWNRKIIDWKLDCLFQFLNTKNCEFLNKAEHSICFVFEFLDVISNVVCLIFHNQFRQFE